MTLLTDLESLIACVPLASLRGTAAGGVRARILDAMDDGRIEFLDAYSLLVWCDERLEAEGVQFSPPAVVVAEPPPAPPPRPAVPPPVILDAVILDRCSRQRWTPDEPVRQGETAHEQISRLENYRLAIDMARERGRDLDDRRARDAIWAAVAAETAVWMRAEARRATEAAA